MIDRLNPESTTEGATKVSVRRRKKAKGPNPLSVKKSRKTVCGGKAVSGGIVSKSKVRITQCLLFSHPFAISFDVVN